MSYEILRELNSFDEIKKLPLEISVRIINKLDQVAENPEHFIERLKDLPEFKVRMGDCRVILLFDKSGKKIKIQAVGHRKNICKKYKSD